MHPGTETSDKQKHRVALIVVFKTNSDFEFVLNSLKLFKTTLFKTATVHSRKYYSTPSSQVLGVDHRKNYGSKP